MPEKTFRGILIAVTVLGVLCTAALVCYTWYLYDCCSLLAYIANRG